MQRDHELTSLLASALDAFYLEHRRCELDAGVEDDRVWMTCSCWAQIVRPLDPAP